MIHLLMVIFSLLLSLTVLAFGAGKFRKAPQVMAAMRHVGINARAVALLGSLEVFGGVGLLVGLASRRLGEASSLALTLYFLCAIYAHRRVHDGLDRYAPALFIFVFALLTTIFQFIR